jgi:serine/threonine protein kinase
VGAIFCPGCRSNIAAEEPVCKVCGLQRPPVGWPVDEQIGRLVHGKYRVDKRLSAGGFGTVFLAMQVHGGIEMGRVILKFLHKEHAQDPNLTKRFLTEVKTARELINPHIVRVFDLGYDNDGTPFMVQEFIEGRGLEEILEQEKRLPPARALKIASQVAEGMAEAHRKQIVHRDLKPENLRLQEGTGLLKILDFGIARVTTTKGTATNSFVGTPRYMPPEQIKQQQLDSGVDIFALGVMTFEMLAGEPPIRTEQSELEYIHLNLIQEPRRLIELLSDCPPDLSEFVDSMMAKDRALRPKDMDAVVAMFETIAKQHGWSDENTGRFSLTSEHSVVAPRTPASPSPAPSSPSRQSTRDRTPSPAAMPAADEEVVELDVAKPKKTGLYAVIAGGAVALLLGIVLIFALSSRGSSGSAAAGPAAGPDAGASAVVDAVGTSATAPGPSAKEDAALASASDAAKPAAETAALVADAVAVAPDAAPSPADAAAPDAAVAVKLEDALAAEIRAAVEAAPPPDAGPVEVAADSGSRRDAVARDAASAPRDTATTARDSGRRDAGNPFAKIGGSDAGANPFSKVPGDAR